MKEVKKPEMITFYNTTNVSVDTIDKKLKTIQLPEKVVVGHALYVIQY